MTAALRDPEEVIAQVVAGESAWVPAWRRLLLSCACVAGVLAALLGRLPLEVVVLVAGLAALVSRLAPVVIAAALGDDPGHVELRVARERVLFCTLCAVLPACIGLGLAAAAGSAAGSSACACALAVVVLPHRGNAPGAVRHIVADWAESMSFVALIPLVVLAVKGWWT